MSSRLRQEVWALERCSGCGLCVATCAKGILDWDGQQHPTLEERQKAIGLSRLKLRTCEVCDKLCELSCPRLADSIAIEPLATVSARAAGDDGGAVPEVVRALLIAAHAAGLIDGAIVLDVDPWTLQPVARVVTSVDELASLVGIPHLWAPVLSALNEAIFERGLTSLAVVGAPCVAEGARRLLETENPRLAAYRKALRLTIAHFCTGAYMPDAIEILVERGLGLPRRRVRRLTATAGGDLVVALWDGSEHTIGRSAAEPFTRRGCGTCSDYLGETADIAVGAIGALAGYSTLIVRTVAGESFVENARAFGLLETSGQADAEALAGAKAEKNRRARGRALAECRILMLDALGDPQKRAQARRRLVELYGAPQEGVIRKEAGGGGCIGCQGGGC